MSDAEQIGRRLREAREAKELSLDEVEQATRIRARFLEALEAGDYSSMTPVMARGFLRNYARFLDLDVDLLQSELDEDKGLFSRRRQRDRLPTTSSPNRGPAEPAAPPPNRLAPRQRPPRPVRRSRGVLGNILVVLLSGAIVVGLVIGATTLLDQWAESETQPGTNAGASPSPPAVPDEMGAPAAEGDASGTDMDTDTEALLAEPDAAASENRVDDYTPPPLTGTSITVAIEIVQDTWIRIAADGVVQYEGTAKEGDILNYTGQESVSVRASNAAGLRLTVNNLPQGVLGSRGQLFEQVFTLNGAAPPGGEIGGDLPDLPSGDTSLSPGSPEVTTTMLPASPTEATLFVTPTATLPLDPGDGSVLGVMTQTSQPVTPTVPPDTATTTPEATRTPTPSPTATRAEVTPTAGVTATATATATPQPSDTATATRTPTPTRTPSPTATRTPTPSPTPSPTATQTLTPTRTPTPTLSPTPSFTPTQTPFLPPRLTRTPSPVPK